MKLFICQESGGFMERKDCYYLGLDMVTSSLGWALTNLKYELLLCGCNICVFVNLKTFLSKKDLQHLYEFANYQKMYLVLMESCEREKIDGEKTFIIDKDECIIEI